MSASDIESISKEAFHIAGIRIIVYGLKELKETASVVHCLWLLHPRSLTRDSMTPIANKAIATWNKQQDSQSHASIRDSGLIAVAFDQRNHGERTVDALSNKSWKSGNRTHAQDMFSIYHGTALDTSLLITYLQSYVFPDGRPTIQDHSVLGISLGGHAAWQCLFTEPRIKIGIVVIGCPDYPRLMCQRARTSHLKSWTASEPPGTSFLGSTDFPKPLMEAVSLHDPASMFMGVPMILDQPAQGANTETEREELRQRVEAKLGLKKILNLAGGADKLVPYECSQPFLDYLQSVLLSKDGWCADNGILLEDVVFEGVGHEMSPQMAAKAVDFLCNALRAEDGEKRLLDTGFRSSKI